MFRSTYEQEREIVLTDSHILEVWDAIEKNFKGYFDRFVSSCQPPTDPEVLARTLGEKFKVKVVAKADHGLAFHTALRDAVAAYEREAAIYRNFFNEDTLQEYEELNASEFKRALQKRQNCPIVNKCVSSMREEMHEWQRKFSGRDPRELRGVFRELYNTATSYASETKPDRYAKYDSWEEMKLDWFDDDENLRAEGVVGTGIKSTVLFHLHPEVFPLCDTDALFAMHFLSGKDSFGLVSNSNEFIMVNDQKADASMIDRIDRNYWYPYPLFTLYQLRIYRLFESACSKLKVSLDSKHRYVYCAAFMRHIVETPPESELVEAMRPVRENVS
jgi:hypothetical protein